MFYPTINEQWLLPMKVVIQQLAADPSYLDRAECPYASGTVDFFKSRIEVHAVDIFAGADEMEVLDKQIIAVINDLEAFAKTLTNDDASEKLQYFKTKTTLIEKLIGMRERILNLKEISEFRNTIIAFMEEVLTKDQIADLIDRLDGTLGVENNES